MDDHRERPTPAWLWCLFAIGLAVFGVGTYLARLQQHPVGMLLVGVGVVVIISFTVLQRRYAKR